MSNLMIKRAMASILLIAIAVLSTNNGALAQKAVSTEDLVGQLVGLETTPNIDVAVLRRQALERAKVKSDGAALNRPPIAVQLFKLPQFTVEIQFDLDSDVIKPASYKTLGSIADALYHPTLLQYKVLVVGHTDSTGKREHNLTLSEKRANAIRDALVTTFGISAKRVQSVGLGEEQLQDAAHPTSAVNRRVQLVAIGKVN